MIGRLIVRMNVLFTFKVGIGPTHVHTKVYKNVLPRYKHGSEYDTSLTGTYEDLSIPRPSWEISLGRLNSVGPWDQANEDERVVGACRADPHKISLNTPQWPRKTKRRPVQGVSRKSMWQHADGRHCEVLWRLVPTRRFGATKSTLRWRNTWWHKSKQLMDHQAIRRDTCSCIWA